MPTLNWLGRDKVLNHHRDVPFHALNKISSGSSGNMIIHADNLLALKALLPRFAAKVKCIYIDPPYNTGNEGWIYNDNVSDPAIQRWLGEVVGKEGEDLSRHDKWLCMMFPRLKLLRELLSDDGAIFISIDDNEQANLKLICDEIFGARNFLAECSVKRSGGRQDSKFYAVVNEYLICYAKNAERFVAGGEVKTGENYPKFDIATGKYYKTQLLRKWGSNSRRIDRPNLFYSITAPDGSELFPMLSKTEEGCWRWGKDKMQKSIDGGLIEFIQKNGDWVAYEKIFEPAEGESRTKKFTTWIDDTFGDSVTVKEIFGADVFDYPKSVGLIERILKMCNVDKDSLILDAFAGSGTTAHAVINLNAADGGTRRFILIEMADYAESITAERVRRVGGEFEYYELGAPLFDEYGFINAAAPVEKLREYIWYSETGKELPAATEEKYLLGVNEGTAYYFCYGAEGAVALDLELDGFALEIIHSRRRVPDVCHGADKPRAHHHSETNSADNRENRRHRIETGVGIVRRAVLRVVSQTFVNGVEVAGTGAVKIAAAEVLLDAAGNVADVRDEITHARICCNVPVALPHVDEENNPAVLRAAVMLFKHVMRGGIDTPAQVAVKFDADFDAVFLLKRADFLGKIFNFGGAERICVVENGRAENFFVVRRGAGSSETGGDDKNKNRADFFKHGRASSHEHTDESINNRHGN